MRKKFIDLTNTIVRSGKPLEEFGYAGIDFGSPLERFDGFFIIGKIPSNTS
jgi:hypothetical protein